MNRYTRRAIFTVIVICLSVVAARLTPRHEWIGDAWRVVCFVICLIGCDRIRKR